MPEQQSDGAQDSSAAQSSKQDTVARLLSEADAAFMRGDWEEATARAQEAVALDPHNADAHIVLGDIYAERQEDEQALRCYRAAWELVDDDVLRLKIEELREKTKLPQPARERPRPAPPLRIPGRRKLAAAATLAGLLIVALIIVVLFAQGRGGEEPAEARGLATETPAVGGTAPASAGQQQPAIPLTAPTYNPIPPPAPAATAPGARPSPQPTPRGSRAARGAAKLSSGHTRQVQRSSQLRGPITDREKLIVYELSQLVLSDGNPIGTYVMATLSPRSESLVITFEVPDEVAAHPAGKAILADANRLAVTAAQVDEGFKTCLVRVLVGYTDRQDGSRHTICIFEAETTRALLEAGGRAAARGRTYNVFPEPWWNERYWGTAATEANAAGTG